MPDYREQAWSQVERMADSVNAEDERRVHENLDRKLHEAKRQGALAQLLDQVRTLYALLRDPDFRIPTRAKALLVAALLYFIMPFDVIPDLFLGIGFLDDAVVIGIVLKLVTSTIEDYRRFRARRPATP